MTAVMLTGCSPEVMEGPDDGLGQPGTAQQGIGVRSPTNSVMVWNVNIHGYLVNRSSGSDGYDGQNFARFLVGSNATNGQPNPTYLPDIITIQECYTQAMTNQMALDLSNWATTATQTVNYSGLCLETRSGRPGVIWRAGRFTKLAHHAHDNALGDPCQPDARLMANLIVKFDDINNSKNIVVASVHFPVEDQCAQTNWNRVLGAVDALATSGDLKIVAGDFNISDGADVGVWRSWYNNTRATGYADTVYDFFGGNMTYVRNAWTKNNKRIDYIFTRNHLSKADGVFNVEPAWTVNRQSINANYSDHPRGGRGERIVY
jgi:endonuclease/exonuclease/phosphatase family metal-dependent hydrolase